MSQTTENFRSTILKHLDSNSYTSQQLFEATQIPKSIINFLLDQLLKQGIVSKETTIPPVWQLNKNFNCSKFEALEGSIPDPELTVVFVDLGNVHDVLQKLIPYIGQHLRVFGICDFHYNGIIPKTTLPFTQFAIHRAQEKCKNAADVLLIWKLHDFVNAHLDKRIQFLIVTKDDGFKYVSHLMQKNHSCIFVKDWDTLKYYIE